MSRPKHTPLSWSHSRARMLDTCMRRYFLHYYMSAGGYRDDADAESRQAYRLKMLTPLNAAIGQAIHVLAGDIVNRIRRGESLPTFEDALRSVRIRLHTLWRSSDDRSAFIRSPKRDRMLTERYYDVPLTPERRTYNRRRVSEMVENLLDWPGWAEVKACSPRHVLSFDPLDPIPFECEPGVSVPLYAAPDLVYRDSRRRWRIVDWKTSRKSSESDRDQIALYYLYLTLQGRIRPGDEVRGVVVNVSMPDEMVFRLGADNLPEIRARVLESIARMRSLVIDGDMGWNDPVDVTQFPLSPRPGLCRSCAFSEICNASDANGFDLQELQLVGLA